MTRDTIISTALVHLSQKGYAGVSLRDIAADVGIKASSIYNHFKGKKEVVEAVYIFIEQQLEGDLLEQEKVQSLTVDSTFGSLWTGWFSKYKQKLDTADYQNIIRLLSIEQYSDSNAARIIIEYMIEKPLKIAEAICGKFIPAGSGADANIFASEFFYPLFGMMHEFILRVSLKQNTLKIEQRMKTHIQFIGRLIDER